MGNLYPTNGKFIPYKWEIYTLQMGKKNALNLVMVGIFKGGLREVKRG